MVPCQPGVPCRVCTEKYGVVEFEVRSVAGMAQYSTQEKFNPQNSQLSFRDYTATLFLILPLYIPKFLIFHPKLTRH